MTHLPAPSSEAYSVWLLVGKTSHKCQRALNLGLAELDLTIAQLDVLSNIQRYSGLDQNQLAERLFVVKSNVSNLLRKLEARGLIVREMDPEDERRKRLQLTPAGARLVALALKQQEHVVARMMSVLNDEDIQITRSVMERVSVALDELLPA